jgi:hypothetical protein
MALKDCPFDFRLKGADARQGLCLRRHYGFSLITFRLLVLTKRNNGGGCGTGPRSRPLYSGVARQAGLDCAQICDVGTRRTLADSETKFDDAMPVRRGI